MTKAFASLCRNMQGRSLRQVCHPPIPGKKTPRQPNRQTDLKPKQIKQTYNDLRTAKLRHPTPRPSSTRLPSTATTSPESRAKLVAKETINKILSKGLAAIQAHHQNRHETLKLAKWAHQLEKKKYGGCKNETKHTTGFKPLQTSGSTGLKAILWHTTTPCFAIRISGIVDGQRRWSGRCWYH